MSQLAVAPILIPLITGALLLLLERKHDTRVLRIGAWLGMGLLLLASLALLHRAHSGVIDIYLLGDWPARLGIALTVDRLSAWLVLTTTVLAIPCLLYAAAGWDRRALHFHALFQWQLMGVNGAFLTGDIFNLFVFFEVMLAASYGLLLSGARGERLAAGMHYVVLNIAASTLFLIVLGLLYGLLGSLNLAEIAVRVASATPQQLPLLRAAFGLLLVVFCAKAALLPLYLWLPETYSRAPMAVAALFTILTKVGLYAIVRVSTLVLGPDAGALAGFARDWLLPMGALTMLLGGLGVVGATRLRLLCAYLVLLSAGALMVAFALGTPDAIAAGLFYLPHSVFATASLFLLVGLLERLRGRAGDALLTAAPDPGRMSAASYLVAAVAVAGLPPLSGFIGKFLLLAAVPPHQITWVWIAILGSSVLTIIGLARAGTRLFWRVVPAPAQTQPPSPPRPSEVAAIMVLLGYGLGMTLAAAPLLDYAQATARQLLAPQAYIQHTRATLPRIRTP